MRLLLDANLGRTLRSSLMADGHDVEWVGRWEKDPGDAAILERAFSDRRILITQDKDFGMLAILLHQPHQGIIRLRNVATFQQPSVVRRVLREYAEDLLRGSIVTATVEETRIRKPDGTDSDTE